MDFLDSLLSDMKNPPALRRDQPKRKLVIPDTQPIVVGKDRNVKLKLEQTSPVIEKLPPLPHMAARLIALPPTV